METIPFHDPIAVSPRDCARTNKLRNRAKALTIQPDTEACEGCFSPVETLTARHDQWLCALCLSLDPASRHEIAARARKVFALVEALRSIAADIPLLVESVVLMSDDEWAMTAQIAGVTLPSLEARVEVVAVLRASMRRAVAQ